MHIDAHTGIHLTFKSLALGRRNLAKLACLGARQIQAGEYDSAYETLVELTAFDPEEPYFRVSLGLVHFALGRTRDAYVAISEGIALFALKPATELSEVAIHEAETLRANVLVRLQRENSVLNRRAS